MPDERKKSWVLKAAGGVLGLGLFAFAVAYLVFRMDPKIEAQPGALPERGSVAAIPSALPKQGPNQCGAYSLAMALRCQGQDADPDALVQVVSHESSIEMLSGTLPWKIRAELTRRGLTSSACTAREAPRERRLDLLKAHLAEGRPVLMLIESERGIQHYVLAVGYGPDGLDLYDPNFEPDPEDAGRTADQNGARAGNRTLAPDAILDLWSRGGGAGLYTWWYVPIAPV